MSQATQTDTGALTTTANNLLVGDYSNGVALARISWLTMISDVVTQTWIDNHFDGILNTDPTDTHGFKEILTIPFVGDERPEPDAIAGLCST